MAKGKSIDGRKRPVTFAVQTETYSNPNLLNLLQRDYNLLYSEEPSSLPVDLSSLLIMPCCFPPFEITLINSDDIINAISNYGICNSSFYIQLITSYSSQFIPDQGISPMPGRTSSYLLKITDEKSRDPGSLIKNIKYVGPELCAYDGSGCSFNSGNFVSELFFYETLPSIPDPNRTFLLFKDPSMITMEIINFYSLPNYCPKTIKLNLSNPDTIWDFSSNTYYNLGLTFYQMQIVDASSTLNPIPGNAYSPANGSYGNSFYITDFVEKTSSSITLEILYTQCDISEWIHDSSGPLLLNGFANFLMIDPPNSVPSVACLYSNSYDQRASISIHKFSDNNSPIELKIGPKPETGIGFVYIDSEIGNDMSGAGGPGNPFKSIQCAQDNSPDVSGCFLKGIFDVSGGFSYQEDWTYIGFGLTTTILNGYNSNVTNNTFCRLIYDCSFNNEQHTFNTTITGSTTPNKLTLKNVVIKNQRSTDAYREIYTVSNTTADKPKLTIKNCLFYNDEYNSFFYPPPSPPAPPPPFSINVEKTGNISSNPYSSFNLSVDDVSTNSNYEITTSGHDNDGVYNGDWAWSKDPSGNPPTDLQVLSDISSQTNLQLSLYNSILSSDPLNNGEITPLPGGTIPDLSSNPFRIISVQDITRFSVTYEVEYIGPAVDFSYTLSPGLSGVVRFDSDPSIFQLNI